MSSSTSVNGPAVHRRRHPPHVPLLHLRRLPPSPSLLRLQEVLLLRRMRRWFPLCLSLVILIAPGNARPLLLPLNSRCHEGLPPRNSGGAVVGSAATGIAGQPHLVPPRWWFARALHSPVVVLLVPPFRPRRPAPVVALCSAVFHCIV